ncbi:MAG: EamA family transporter [Bacteroidales bacterium]|nr:EamA family transporter [Bacteroidales bacterium]MBN2758680.1 EamA family transporter [Bacteroidales bacterium]
MIVKIKSIDLNNKSSQWIVLSLLALIWGSSFILMKKGLESYSDMQVAAFRIFISFMLLTPFVFQRLKRIKKENIKSLLIVGFIGNGIPAFLFTKAQTQVDSSIAGMLNSLTPLFALLIGLSFYKIKIRWLNILGITIGLVGAAGLILSNSSFNFRTDSLYPILIVVATLFYGISVNEIKQKLPDIDAVTIIAIAFLFIGPLAGFYLFTSDFSFALSTDNYQINFFYVFILAAFSSVIATIIFNALIKSTTALFASSVTYLIPIVAILWGVLDGELISITQVLFIVIILAGVYLVNKK